MTIVLRYVDIRVWVVEYFWPHTRADTSAITLKIVIEAISEEHIEHFKLTRASI